VGDPYTTHDWARALPEPAKRAALPGSGPERRSPFPRANHLSLACQPPQRRGVQHAGSVPGEGAAAFRGHSRIVIVAVTKKRYR